MKRKKFILLATAGVATLAIPTWYYKYRDIEYDPLLTTPALLSYIWDDETLVSVGKKYREGFPDEDNERALVNSLSKDLSSTDSLTTALQQQIKHDYQNEQMVMIEGWLLSITEARQCALFSIAQSN